MSLDRRTLLKGGLSGLLAGMVPAGLMAAEPARRRVLRAVFLTDAHVTPAHRERADRAFELAARRRPDLWIFGGDNVMAVDQGQDEAKATEQHDIWTGLLERHVKSRPRIHVIGNHDIWWTGPAAHRWHAKSYALETFGMPKRYYRHDQAGWTFLLLDVFHREGCLVDAEQMEWLKSELANARHVVVVSHAPTISATHFVELGGPKDGAFQVPTSWMVSNTVEVVKAMREAGNVRLALSGHMHHIDRVDLYNSCYICGGAVSGAWWGGEYHAFPPAFIELELFDDGTFSHRPVYWETAPKWRTLVTR